MALTNKLKTTVDQPVWEWLRFAPASSTSISAWTTSEDGLDRYIYYLVGAAFYRYDTISDSWQTLAALPVNPTNDLSLQYQKYSGYKGRVLSATSSTITVGYISHNLTTGTTIKITDGTGRGQTTTITGVGSENIIDTGVATTSSTSLLTDSTKKWKINQWVGYNCRINYGTGVTQQRTVIYNDNTTLYFSDANYQPYESFHDQVFAVAPATTGTAAPSMYILSTQTLTVSATLSPVPDNTSRFTLNTGIVWVVMGNSSLLAYDVVSDFWMTKTLPTPTNLFGTNLGTDITLEKIGETAGAYLTGTASAGANRTLTDSTKTMVQDRWRNYQIRITGGTGIGQKRRIVANGTNYFEVATKWETNPDATSTYSIFANTDVIYLAGNGSSALYQYHTEADLWSQSGIYDYGITNNMTVTRSGTLPVGVTSGTRNTGGVTGVTAAPVAAGSGYKVGDILTLSTTGTNGKVIVETVSSAGAILTVSLYRSGSGYATGTSATTGGTGSAATINISSVGTVGLVVTVINHFFKIGDSITFAGANEAAWNTTYTIIGCDALTQFDVAITATATAVATATQSTTLLVDPSKNWDVNEHVGKLLNIQTVGSGGTPTIRRITSNTSNTITFGVSTAGVNGTSRYIITDVSAFGRDNQLPMTNQYGFGYATSGTTATIVDSSKAWVPGSWIGYKVRITAGTGLGAELSITDNNATTLTFTTQTFTPDTTTRYEIMDTFGTVTATGTTSTLTDSTKNWKVGQWIGKRVKMIAGTGSGQEALISGNTATGLTFGIVTTAPDATTQYVIYSVPARSTGINLLWSWGNGNDRYLWSPRGGAANTVDVYNTSTEMYEYGIFLNPQTETFTTGTMYSYSYDSVNSRDRIYICNSVGQIRYIDLAKRAFVPSGTIPYGMSNVLLGNRMEIITTTDGLQFLYLQRHSGQECWRTLLFW